MQWLAEICVHRPVFATVIVMFLTVVGGFSFFTLGVDRFPKIDLPTISVWTDNTGAAPAEMETEVTDIIEGALNTVPGIDEMRSSSSRGSSNVTLTFNLDKDPGPGLSGDPAKIERRRESFAGNCRSADGPKKRPRFAARASVRDQRAARRRRSLGYDPDTLMDRIESADGVGEVFAYGVRQKQIKLYVNPDRLRAYNLSVTQVTSAVTRTESGTSRRNAGRGRKDRRVADDEQADERF